jgi:hypothetical protein
MVRDLARLFLDEDKRVASLRNLHRKAALPAIHSALRGRFRSIPDQWSGGGSSVGGVSQEAATWIQARWREQDQEYFEESFDEGWAKVSSAVATIGSDPVARGLATLRDKFHAHLEVTPLGTESRPFDVSSLGLKYTDLFAFADRYVQPAFELVRIITGKVFALDSFASMHRRQGAEMWRVLAGLAVGKDRVAAGV